MLVTRKLPLKEALALASSYLVSPAAAAFLARSQVSFGLLLLKLRHAQEREIFKRRISRRQSTRPLNVQLERRRPLIIRGGCLGSRRGHSEVSVRKHIGNPRLLLRCLKQDFQYVETASGAANLALFGVSLPESICAGLSGGHMRFSEIIDTARFFGSGDPRVTFVQNGSRSNRTALVLRLQLSFNSSQLYLHSR